MCLPRTHVTSSSGWRCQTGWIPGTALVDWAELGGASRIAEQSEHELYGRLRRSGQVMLNCTPDDRDKLSVLEGK